MRGRRERTLSTRFLRAKLFVIAIAVALPGWILAARNDRPKIGFAIEAMKGERWQTDLEAFRAQAKALGADVVSADAGGDDDKQLQQVKEMIKGGIDVLVLLPHDTTKASRAVDAAKAATVKVISYDRLAMNSDVDLYMSFDRDEIGTMQAEYLVQRGPKGNYVLIGGSPSDEGAKALHAAQMKVLRPFVERGDIKVVADGYIQDWVASDAYIFMLKAIENAHGDVTAVVAANDALAAGAIQALREHNLAGKTLVSGQDADLASVICIAEGVQSMTVYKPVTQEAKRTAEEAVRLAKREKIEAGTMINNGKIDVPTILLKPITVSRANIKETVVKDGFQTLTSINRTLPEERQIH
jgi:D-xylose transport system substrate-binding protein